MPGMPFGGHSGVVRRAMVREAAASRLLRVGRLLAAALLHRAGLGVGHCENDGLVVGLTDAGDGAVVDLILGGAACPRAC